MPRIARTLATALGLFGAAAASQGPEFAQQYRQRLGGAVDELRRVVERFDGDARATGRTRDEAIRRLQEDREELVRRQGDAASVAADRLARLEEQQRRFGEAGSFARLGVMLSDLDPDLARATFRDFEPAMPVTQEGFVTAALGFLAAWAGLHGTAAVARMPFRRRRQGVVRRRVGATSRQA